ncbi:MAG: hemerythrin domain-containing protein [Alphaproteobacteria bacterium]|nr:hemerythrin domain-containing protein [Alphaproteobacteria bacterium]
MKLRDKKPDRNGADQANAIVLLEADHLAVAELFEEYEDARGKQQKSKVARQICLELSVHTMIEEELLYPVCRGGAVEEDLLDEAYVEHDGAKMLIAELLAGTPDDEFYDAKVKVLSEMIKHHVKEEEQPGGLFAQVKKADIDLDALGARMAERKQVLKKEFLESGIPAPTTRSLSGAAVEHGVPLEAPAHA